MPKLKLTQAAVDRLLPPSKGQIDIFDKTLPGFGLRITHHGVKSYTCFYRVGGKQRRETLGRHPTLGLAAARVKAGEIFTAAGQGRDPRLEREQLKADNARADADIYEIAVEDFIRLYAIAKKNNRTHQDQRKLLLRLKEWHGRPVASITSRDAHELLDAFMARGTSYLANRTYEQLCTFWKWLYQRDRVLTNIMDKVARPFDGEKPRTRIWTENELRRIWRAADSLGQRDGTYLRLLLLLGQRLSEVAGMRWDELDLDGLRRKEIDYAGPTWTLPASRAKVKRAHTFPLAAEAVRLLWALPRVEGNPFVFPSTTGNRAGDPCPMQPGTRDQRAINELTDIADFHFHDARRTFRTTLDRLRFPPHIKLDALHHTRQGVGDRHYSQYTYLSEQAEAFEAWAKFLLELDAPVDGVTSTMVGKR